MVLRPLVGTSMLAVLASGCYMDLTMGVQRAGGGATGFGWELGLAGGVAFDVGPVRPGVAIAAAMRRNNVEDGKFGTTGLAYHARVDVAISKETQISEDEIRASHPGMTIPPGGATSTTRLVLDYGLGKYEELMFMAPGDPTMYTHKSTTHSVYLGLAKDYDVSSVKASFSFGPSVTLIPNDFVGDTTAIGAQFHASFWFIPIFKRRKAEGSLWDTYSGPSEIKSGPEAPGPIMCVDKWGTRKPCDF